MQSLKEHCYTQNTGSRNTLEMLSFAALVVGQSRQTLDVNGLKNPMMLDFETNDGQGLCCMHYSAGNDIY